MFSKHNLIFVRKQLITVLVTKGYCGFGSVCSSSIAFLFVSKTFPEMRTFFFWNLAVFDPMLSCAWDSFRLPQNWIFHLFGKKLVICFFNRWKFTLFLYLTWQISCLGKVLFLSYNLKCSQPFRLQNSLISNSSYTIKRAMLLLEIICS